MKKIELEEKASKCFDSFDTYWKKLTAFKEDYMFFALYMKRHTTSGIDFLPSVYLKSFQSVINDYSKDDEGLEKAFNVFTITKQIILDMQDWNKSVYEETERNELLKEIVKYEYVDIDLFCNDFISCSHAHADIRQKIEDIINDT
jgi:hypothetical protein